MKNLILYSTSFGRNDGCPLYYYNVLKNKLKLDLDHSDPRNDIPNLNTHDLVWWIDWGEDGLPLDVWKLQFPEKGKRIYVCSDAHLGSEYRFKRAQMFDYVFFNQERFIDEYKSFTPKGIWEKQHIEFLPHAAEPQAYPKFNIVKKYDVGFIGHLQDETNYNGLTRVGFLDTMFKEFPNFYFGVRNPQKPEINVFEDAAKKFAQTKICLNTSIKDDLNMRLSEICSSGSFQLTNWLPTLHHMYEDDKHLVTYKTQDEAIEKAKYYLEHDDEREAIAKAGHEHFLANHTYEHRVRHILNVVGFPLDNL